MQRANSSVHLGSSLGQTQRSSQRLSQNRPPSDLQFLFSLPHHPLRLRLPSTEEESFVPNAGAFSRRDVAFRERPPFTGPIREAGHLLNRTGLSRGTQDSSSLGRVCRPDWFNCDQVAVRGQTSYVLSQSTNRDRYQHYLSDLSLYFLKRKNSMNSLNVLSVYVEIP